MNNELYRPVRLASGSAELFHIPRGVFPGGDGSGQLLNPAMTRLPGPAGCWRGRYNPRPGHPFNRRSPGHPFSRAVQLSWGPFYARRPAAGPALAAFRILGERTNDCVGRRAQWGAAGVIVDGYFFAKAASESSLIAVQS